MDVCQTQCLLYRTHIVALEVKVCEVESNTVLLRRHDLPDAELVWRVELGEAGRLQGAVCLVDVAAARVCCRRKKVKIQKTKSQRSTFIYSLKIIA
ncbi:hypothetical protein DPMN_025537 [Dreissena polymorpha]|uniref:Uncharacterized protein n=1 Tax=Dreissena polymorpha TaxID=45954 RepID=A0A9D4LQ04_DREPO|nr:hypothetical protein DPMN_025537 [Dreissena polymorpha]